MGIDEITNNMNSNNFNNNNNNGNENEASINNEQNESNSFDDGKRKGMRAMISSVLQLTNCLKTSSPMAATYISMGSSRFQYSHKFQYIDLKQFDKDTVEDFDIETDSNNVPFLKSEVLNYLIRPTDRKYNDLPLYEFLSNYQTTYKNIDEDFEWAIPNLKNNNAVIYERKKAQSHTKGKSLGLL